MFHPPKFLITLLVIDSQFVISPHFRKNATFPTICAKLLFPPISLNWIVQISISFNLRVFAYFTWFSLHPYFDHRHFLHRYNARTGRLCFLVVLFSSLLRYFDFALLSEIIVLFTRRQCPLARSLRCLGLTVFYRSVSVYRLIAARRLRKMLQNCEVSCCANEMLAIASD